MAELVDENNNVEKTIISRQGQEKTDPDIKAERKPRNFRLRSNSIPTSFSRLPKLEEGGLLNLKPRSNGYDNESVTNLDKDKDFDIHNVKFSGGEGQRQNKNKESNELNSIVKLQKLNTKRRTSISSFSNSKGKGIKIEPLFGTQSKGEVNRNTRPETAFVQGTWSSLRTTWQKGRPSAKQPAKNKPGNNEKQVPNTVESARGSAQLPKRRQGISQDQLHCHTQSEFRKILAFNRLSEYDEFRNILIVQWLKALDY